MPPVIVRILILIFAVTTLPSVRANDPPPNGGQTTLVLAYLSYYQMDALKNFYTDVYKELGYRTRFVEMPMERRLVALNDGAIDGILIGSPELIDLYPNILQVPPPITYPKLLFVCGNQVTHCNSTLLATKDIDVHASSGSMKMYKSITGNAIGADVIVLEDERRLQEVVSLRNIDHALITVAIDSEYQALKSAHHVVEVGSAPLFHYIHKRHIALTPGLSATIQSKKNVLSLFRQNR